MYFLFSICFLFGVAHAGVINSRMDLQLEIAGIESNNATFILNQLSTTTIQPLPKPVCGIVGEGKNRDFFVTPSSSRSKRVAGGSSVGPGSFQLCWQVLLRINNFGEKSYCGGSIIGPQTILTAAHCVKTKEESTITSPKNVIVTVGSTNTDINGADLSKDTTGCAQNYNVFRVFTHPDHDSDTRNNDIAILTLEHPIDFLDKRCACMLCVKDQSPSTREENCIAIGMGQRFQGESHENRPLQWVQLNVTDESSEHCPVTEGTDKELFVCAGSRGKGVCKGDSGGALACLDEEEMFYAAGVTSFTKGDCGTEYGAQFARTQVYLPWITEHTS